MSPACEIGLAHVLWNDGTLSGLSLVGSGELYEIFITEGDGWRLAGQARIE